MNLFRLTGDLSHLLAILVLLWKIWKSRSCAGKFSLCVSHLTSFIAQILAIKLSFHRFDRKLFNIMGIIGFLDYTIRGSLAVLHQKTL